MSRRTKVKICGLMSAELAKQTADLGPDMIGFVFAASRRQVSPEQAADIISVIRQTHSAPLAAGVFVDPHPEELERTVRTAGLDMIQLHGKETPELCETIKRMFPEKAVFKVFAPTEEDGPAAAVLEPYRHCADGLMLDTAGGGTGKTFDWRRIPDYALWAKQAGLPLWIAGGLTPDNVGELLGQYPVDGVDVSSGVETNGVKDIAKIAAFVERVNSIDQSSA